MDDGVAGSGHQHSQKNCHVMYANGIMAPPCLEGWVTQGFDISERHRDDAIVTNRQQSMRLSYVEA